MTAIKTEKPREARVEPGMSEKLSCQSRPKTYDVLRGGWHVLDEHSACDEHVRDRLCFYCYD